MTEEEIKIIEETKKIIEKNIDLPGGMDIIKEAMNKMYRYFKERITESNLSDKRLLEIFIVERMLEKKFLPINSEPEFDLGSEIEMPIRIADNSDCKKVMDYIVYQTRKKLSRTQDIKTSTLEKQCINTSYEVEKICEEVGISQTRYCCKEDLSNGIYHCFNIISLSLPDGNINYYLVDCTYRQFFTYDASFFERIGVPFNGGPNIGSFMLMNEDRKKMAEELLVKGYIEFTPDVAKMYFDAFIFSGRNGLYYQSLEKDVLDKNDYEINYTFEDYLMALNGHPLNEPYIGRQRGVLNKKIIFDNDESLSKLK